MSSQVKLLLVRRSTLHVSERVVRGVTPHRMRVEDHAFRCSREYAWTKGRRLLMFEREDIPKDDTTVLAARLPDPMANGLFFGDVCVVMVNASGTVCDLTLNHLRDMLRETSLRKTGVAPEEIHQSVKRRKRDANSAEADLTDIVLDTKSTANDNGDGSDDEDEGVASEEEDALDDALSEEDTAKTGGKRDRSDVDESDDESDEDRSDESDEDERENPVDGESLSGDEGSFHE